MFGRGSTLYEGRGGVVLGEEGKLHGEGQLHVCEKRGVCSCMRGEGGVVVSNML